MGNKRKITSLAIAASCLLMLLYVYGGSGGTVDNTFNSKYENDKNNDGLVDAVYYYTYDVEGNEIKVEIDSNNDGEINEVCCYNLITDMNNESIQ